MAKKLHVLVVDDQIFNIVVLEDLLANLGNVEVVTACNGKEALEKVENEAQRGDYFELVFMDCNMPVMDGFDASKGIRDMFKQKKILKDPYICAVTAYTTDGFKKKCFACGMDEFLSKPITSDKINQVIAKLKR